MSTAVCAARVPQIRPTARGTVREHASWETWAALVLMLLVGYRAQPQGGITVGDVVAIAALPVTWRSARHSRIMGTILLATVLALATGLSMSLLLTGDLAVSSTTRRFVLLMGAAIPAGACAITWARDRLGLENAVIVFCIGLLLNAVQKVPSVTNPWKFALGMPTSILVLALAHRLGRRAEILAVAALGTVYLVKDSRSAVGFLLITGVLLLVQAVASWLRVSRPPRATARLQVLSLVALGAVTIMAVLSASKSGLLGEAAQTRTVVQSDGSSSVLVQARPELGASLSLIAHRLWGYGTGVVPSYSDVRVAMQGMSSLASYDPQNNYVLGYMFSTAGVELHSGLADLWVSFSLPGLLLGVLLLGTALIGLGRNLATLRSRGWLLLVCVVVVWNLLFGPLADVMPYLQLAVAATATLPPVALLEREHRRAGAVRG